jgi:predicted nucleic acid-binding protein
MILIDSSMLWIDDFKDVPTRQTNLLDGCLGREPLLSGDLILAEVLQSFHSDLDFRRAKAALDILVFAPMVSRDIALARARSHRKLRALGITVRRAIDVIIATFCIEASHRLLHGDQDFTLMKRPLGLVSV